MTMSEVSFLQRMEKSIVLLHGYSRANLRVQSNYNESATKLQPNRSQSAIKLKVQSKCNQTAIKLQSKCNQSTIKVDCHLIFLSNTNKTMFVPLNLGSFNKNAPVCQATCQPSSSFFKPSSNMLLYFQQAFVKPSSSFFKPSSNNMNFGPPSKKRRGGLHQRLAAADRELEMKSSLYSLLMLHYAKGLMSGALVHSIAVAAQKDLDNQKEGYKIIDLQKITHLKHGKIWGHQADLPDPFEVDIPMQASSPHCPSASILLPH